jgi:heme-degrading monooxygenase HmoA
MIEATFSYDFTPNMDHGAYADLVRRATRLMVAADGFVEFRAHRNLVGNPHVRRTSVWESLSDWAALTQQPEYQAITEEFRTFVVNLDVQLWGPSPLTPEPVTRQGDR